MGTDHTIGGWSALNRTLLSLAVTASLLLSMLVFAGPSNAVLTTVSGPDEVTKPGPVTFELAVEIREGERVPIEHFTLVLETDEGESVTVAFAPNGTVLAVTPSSGVVGEGEIRVELLRRTLEIAPVESNADFGYGYGYGTDERTGEVESFGYGYGYGYGGAQPGFEFRVTMDTKALKHGEYTLQLSVDTGEGDPAFASNEKAFEVLVPAGIQPGDDRPADPADDAPGTGDERAAGDDGERAAGADADDDDRGDEAEATDADDRGQEDDDRNRGRSNGDGSGPNRGSGDAGRQEAPGRV